MTPSRPAVFVCVFLAVAAGSSSFARQTDDDKGEARDIPAAFAPFEYLVGQWTGQGVNKDNPAQQFRGWTEKHAWAWIFEKGKPVGLSFKIEGSKFLESGKVTFDPKQKVYRLEGKQPDRKHSEISFEGKLDKTGKLLVFERKSKKEGTPAQAGEMRISIRPNANFLRYTMMQDLKPDDAIQFAHAIEVGVTKEGEAFAAGAASVERPKCIVTGGQATMSVTFEGQTFPLCCSGCLGEFNESPQKYVKKAALMLANQATKPRSAAPPPKRGRDDVFAGDVVEPSTKPPAEKASTKEMPAAKKAVPAAKDDADGSDTSDAKDKPAPKKDAGKAPVTKASRAATLVRLGRTLERSGKTEAALANYRQVVKDYPDTPSVKTAKERIKALEKE